METGAQKGRPRGYWGPDYGGAGILVDLISSPGLSDRSSGLLLATDRCPCCHPYRHPLYGYSNGRGVSSRLSASTSSGHLPVTVTLSRLLHSFSSDLAEDRLRRRRGHRPTARAFPLPAAAAARRDIHLRAVMARRTIADLVSRWRRGASGHCDRGDDA